ncbi:hypothetical protein EV426DRAFT_709976 [Tirmania nivea]|nr:hypothetical protein EV426DRAFT_709976 [Tirmania nivea]
MGGEDKDDHPIAREEILERLQLIWDFQDYDIEDEQDEDNTSNEDNNIKGDDEDNEDEDEDIEDAEDIQDSNLNHDNSMSTNNWDEVHISNDNDSDDKSIV